MAYESYVHYFPHALRDDAEALLANAKKGTFLVRPSSRDGALVISLLQAKKILHLLILRRGQGFGVDPTAWKNHSLKNETFVSLELLIARLRQLSMLSEGLVRTDLDAGDITGDPLAGDLLGAGVGFDDPLGDAGVAAASAELLSAAGAAPGTPPFDPKRHMLMADQKQTPAALALGFAEPSLSAASPSASPASASASASSAAAATAAAAHKLSAAFAGDAKDAKAAPAIPSASSSSSAAGHTPVPTPGKPASASAAIASSSSAAAASPAPAVAGGSGGGSSGSGGSGSVAAANSVSAAIAALASSSLSDSMGALGREELKRVLALSEQSAKESEYKGMLQAMLLDGKLGMTEVGALTEWRNKNAFTDAQHAKVLHAIGLTVDEFDALKRFEATDNANANAAANSDANLCVICLAEPRQTVFVDCGHFACCMHCAGMVTMCPLCRSPSTKHIKVFS